MSSFAEKFVHRLKSINVGLYKDLVDSYVPHFRCVFCNIVPSEVPFMSMNCSHYICQNCLPSLQFPEDCLKCGEEITEGNIQKDPLYSVFYECFKQSNSSSLSDKRWTLDDIKNVRKINSLLQDECRKIFKKSGGDIENVKLLINCGANPNVLNRDGWTLMHEAVDYENVRVLEILLEGGGIVNAYSLDRCRTPLHDALNEYFINEDIIQTLLDYGANVNLRDRTGLSSLKKVEHNEYMLNLLTKRQRIHNIPLKTKPIGPPVIYGCNLPHKLQKALTLFCSKFKLKICRQKISKDVTHVIVECDPCIPHHGVLMGILQGCFIIDFKWIEDCLKTMSIVNPEPYELTGTTWFPKTFAPKRSRLNSAYLKPRLFAGGQFKILDGLDERLSLTDKEEIMDLIVAGGGKVLTRTKSCGDNIGESFFYHAHNGPLKYCTVVVLHKNKPNIRGWDTIGHASIHWLYNSIQAFKLLP